MTEPRAYLCGQFLPLSAVSVPIYDGGFLQGTTVAEVLRTFRGRLFRLDKHLDRLRRSLAIVDIEPGVQIAELGRVAERLAAENRTLLAPGDDLALTIFVTPGPNADLAPPDAPDRPLVCVHTRPLSFEKFAAKYEDGDALVISSVPQVSARCWPPELKCRSRMHYYLADRQARRIDPEARALLLDEDGMVCEATTANVVAYFAGEGVVSPPHGKILPGISVAMIADLCRALGIAFVERDLSPSQIERADEILLCSTSPCVLPVVRLNGKPVGAGRPGPIFGRLLAAWGDEVGVDIAAQARQFSRR
jgi:branched-subunit amino acid aminotransferase/4-amino-4-deoxychorismate lyase